MRLHFVCVHTGSRYPREYVHNLFGALTQYTPYQYDWDFTVVSETEWPQYSVLTPPKGVLRYWAKLPAYQRGAFPDGELCMYFDIDVLIRGSLAPLLKTEPDPFVIMKDPIFGHRYNASVTYWRAGSAYTTRFWDWWEQEGRDAKPRVDFNTGDSAWTEWVCRQPIHPQAEVNLPKLWPNNLVRGYYRRQDETRTEHGGLPWYTLDDPGDIPVIVFHGRPRFHELPLDHWARKEWDRCT